MPSVPGLPEDQLHHARGLVRGKQQRIRALFEQWFYGKMPQAPDIFALW